MNKYPKDGLTNKKTADLTWLTGVWNGQGGDQTIEEHWSSLDGGALMAMFRWLKEGSVWFYEFMTIEAEEDGRILLRIKHFYPGLKGWEEKDNSAEFLLVQLQDQKAVFLQINKPNNPWMIYHRETAERLVAYFEKEDEDVEEDDKFVYSLQLSH